MFRSKCKEHDHSTFYQPLQMEHSQKNSDCYFFYYSTCKKGDRCPFRHEPSALGCETMCRYWKEGNCIDEHCNFRHMELKKNRKSIPCYWEQQPGGCKKPHCSFMHNSARSAANEAINPVKISDLPAKPVNQEWSNHQKETKYGGSSTESDQGRGSSEASSFIGSPAVDPLIVKFEKESDSESVPSPVKPQPRVPYCKTYEEIRLEEIQAESAAYYSYEAAEDQSELGGGKMKTVRSSRKISPYPRIIRDKSEENSKELNFEILTLEEIRRRKARKALQGNQHNIEVRSSESVHSEEELQKEFLKDAIKDLAELKAERVLRGNKRSIDDCNIEALSEDRPIKRRAVEDNTSPTKVPPVRLRRCAKKFAAGGWESENVDRDKDELTRINSPEKTQLPDPTERLATRQNSTEEVESSNTNRKKDVEVRLCDSSTDEDQSKIEKEDRKSIGTGTADNATTKTSQLLYDNLLNINEDDYLSLDTTSADILKDIDALLTEKDGTE